jgi:hypothetical protein
MIDPIFNRESVGNTADGEKTSLGELLTNRTLSGYGGGGSSNAVVKSGLLIADSTGETRS